MGSADFSHHSSLTIREVVEHIYQGSCLVPAAHEGDLVLAPSQIIALFDFVMRQHGIGTFLFWSLDKKKIRNYQFFEMSKDGKRGKECCTENEDDDGKCVTVVLDGRRRLTSLYAGLKGSNGSGIPWEAENDTADSRDRVLYLNILSEPSKPDEVYDFRFLTFREAMKKDHKTHWFDVGRVLDFRGAEDIARFLDENNLIEEETARRVLCRLYQVINERGFIRYYLETSEELGDVMMKFV
jgi:hypothetical protein